MITFFVAGKPQGKGRPRFGKRVVYTPQKTLEYEHRIASCYDGDMLTGALFCDITAYFAIPKSYTKKQREAIKNGDLTPTKKPDADNISKVVLDGLQGVCFLDDKDVIDLRVVKKYSEEREGLEITIGEINV